MTWLVWFTFSSSLPNMACSAAFPLVISRASGIADAVPGEWSKILRIQSTTTSSGTSENAV